MSLEPDWVMEKLLNSRILWSQYSQRMAEVMLKLKRLEEQRRNLIYHDKVLELTSSPRCNTLRQSSGWRVTEVFLGVGLVRRHQ